MINVKAAETPAEWFFAVAEKLHGKPKMQSAYFYLIAEGNKRTLKKEVA